MGLAKMKVLAVLLACAVSACCAIPEHFPHDKTLIYKYYADLKAGVNDPAAYASQFALEGHLHVKHDNSDPTLKHAYYVALTGVKHGLRNGVKMQDEQIPTTHPLVDAVKVIQDPFLIVYDDSGKFQGVKMLKGETGWSKNMKFAIASLLQLDLPSIFAWMSRMEHEGKATSFMSTENTIHGDCHVYYNVQPGEDSNKFVVTKTHDTKNCTHFVQTLFSSVESEDCHVQVEDSMTTTTHRVFHMENLGHALLMKKLVGVGMINYLPWHARSEAHYLLSNQTLLLENVVPVHEVQLPVVNFQNQHILRDMTFEKPKSTYASHAAEDLTYGRHVVRQDVLIPKVKKMLSEAADYLEENHLEMKDLDWKHGQTINRIVHTLSFMSIESLQQVFDSIHEHQSSKDVTMMNLFLGIIPHVGTHASCLFVKNLMTLKTISDVKKIFMLARLPMHVRNPTGRFLVEMEAIINLGDNVSLDVKQASILCFSTLVHKTYMHHHSEHSTDPQLQHYLRHFFNHFKSEPTYTMKIVYLMAIKNVGVGNIHKMLGPIVTSSEESVHIRVMAVWAMKKAVGDDVEYTHNVLWPILTNATLPVTLRVATYDVLVSQLPHMGRIMNIHWMMMHEKNEHLYNYHMTTMQGLANSVMPCLKPVREMARKVLRLTKIRHIEEQLSFHNIVDYHDPVYGHGEMWKSSVVFHKQTGLPYVGYVEHFTSTGRKPINVFGVHWNVEGLDEVMQIFKQHWNGSPLEVITNQNVKNLLHRAAEDMPAKKPIHFDLFLTMNDHVVLVNHFEKETLLKLMDIGKQWKAVMTGQSVLSNNVQTVSYENMFEMLVPTDMGLPGVMGTKIPNVVSFKMNTIIPDLKKQLSVRFQMDARVWKHGEYAMSIYNPMVDVWHSVHKVMTQDIILPLDLNLDYNQETKSIKASFPRLPVTKFSVGGIMHRSKSYVTVTHDEADMLKKSCDSCHHQEVVTQGAAFKHQYQTVSDSKDTGLQCTVGIFDCEAHLTPVVLIEEWMRSVSSEHKNTGDNERVLMIMGIRQMAMNLFISPRPGSCGHFIKIEPSIFHPTSQVQLNVRFNVENLDYANEAIHALSHKKVNVRGSMDVKAASTGISVRTWDMNVNFELSPGHVSNSAKIQITRIVPGEKNLKICIDAQKNYPLLQQDQLKLNTTVDETNVKVTIVAGQTDEDKCVKDDFMVTITVKGELSEDQKKLIADDKVNGLCKRDKYNAEMYGTTEGMVPKTWNCMYEAMRHTTLRKYAVNVDHKKVPSSIMSKVIIAGDLLRAIYLPHIKYTTVHGDPGNMKMIMEYPVGSHHMDMTVVTGVHDMAYEIVDMPMGHPIWNMWMDNTHFSMSTLHKFTNGLVSYCTIHPHVLLTFDNSSFPMIIPKQWTLVSGDHIHESFAIFVKSLKSDHVQGRLAMKMFVGGHELEVTNTDTTTVVTLDGQVVENYHKGLVVPPNEYDFPMLKLTENYEHIIIQTHHVPIMVMIQNNQVTIVADTILQGHVTGICGHMDKTHKEKIPKIYNIASV